MRIRIAVLISAIWLILVNLHAAPISFLQSVPESGKEISTFNISLKFDVTEFVQQHGSKDVTVGYVGDDYGCTYLYEGTAEKGKLIEKIMIDGFDLESTLTDNVVTVNLPFSTNLVPEEGKTYTIVCRNEFDVLIGGRFINGALIDYYDEPLILTFIGGTASSEELVFQKASVTANENLESIVNIDFEFNAEFDIIKNNGVLILHNDNIVYTVAELLIEPDNAKVLRAIFNDATLYYGNQYSVKLSEGTLRLKGNNSVQNNPVEIKVNGLSKKTVSVKSIYPENNLTLLPEKATIKFNFESVETLTPPGSIEHKRSIDFYKNEISDENFISTLLGTASGDGITWDLSTFQFEPETKYILRKKEDDITVWVNGKSQPAYGNEEVIINFTTPSVEDAGFTPLEFITPNIKTELLSNSVEYTPDMAIPSLHTFITELKDQKYKIGTQVYDLTKHPNAQECGLYEVGTDGDKLVKSFNLYVYQAEGKYGFWNRANVELITPLYEGKKYKLVIPEGYFTVYPEIKDIGQTQDLSKCNYIKSKEMAYTFTGTAPTKSVLLGCNIEDNAEVSSLYNIIWTFEGDYQLGNTANTVKREYTSASGIPTVPQEYPVTISTYMGKTYVMVDFVSKITGKPLNINKGTTSTFTVPKGLIVNTLNDEIVNDEIVLTVKGTAEEATEPETVWVNMTINGMHTTAHPAVKGKTYTFSLNPGTDWKIKSVKNGSTNLTGIASDPENPQMKTFVMTALKGNTNVDAELEYDGHWAKEDSTTKVWTIEANNIRIYCDNNMIVVDGVTPENTINVYNVAGMFINTTHVSDGNDRVYISVPLHQTYIVSVDGFAAKIYVE